MPLLRVLNEAGKLNEFQAQWLMPRREALEYYDLKADPKGLHNIAKEPKVVDRMAAMRSAMDKWINTSLDHGAQGDPPTEPLLSEIQRDKRHDYERIWKSRVKKAQPSDAERVAWWEKSYGLSLDQRIP
jgi:hypothetical protein